MSQLDKHICCWLKVPQDQTNSQFFRPTVAMPSALHSTRGRSSYLGVLQLEPEEHTARDWIQEHRDLDFYCLEGQQGSQNKELLHNVLELTDGMDNKRVIINHTSSLVNVRSISFLFPHSFPGNWKASASAVCNPKQDLHFCSHSPYRMTKLKQPAWQWLYTLKCSISNLPYNPILALLMFCYHLLLLQGILSSLPLQNRGRKMKIQATHLLSIQALTVTYGVGSN